ncbi:hypothetical protein B296_00023143 [Ensete ventricosum]|uniref:Uncharacterized protein n=1 Tax=Ensete ventricosum TaxID=4639 RepID=A0A426XA61_ENSVE|nr:hypothetical protein B296_00023143 [Ensete ventricosum]
MIGSYLVLSGLWFHIYVVDLGGLAKELQAAAKSKTNWEKDEMRPRFQQRTDRSRGLSREEEEGERQREERIGGKNTEAEEEEEEEGGGLSDGGSGGRGERRGGRHISGEREERGGTVREAVGITGGLPCARMPIAGHRPPLQEEDCRFDGLGLAGVAPRAERSDEGLTWSDRTEINERPKPIRFRRAQIKRPDRTQFSRLSSS